MWTQYKHLFKTFLALTFALLVFLNLLQWAITSSSLYGNDGTPRQPRHPVKTILFWNPFFDRRDYYFGLGAEAFYENGCASVDCVTTDDSKRLGDADVVIFHGPEFDPRNYNASSVRRSEQLYVYLSMESPLNRIMSGTNDGFFNMTLTYRLDSDIQLPYFYFYENDRIVAPSYEPRWRNPDYTKLQKYHEIFDRKSKPVAWFSSNCNSHSRRESKVKDLKKYIQVDVYGSCGKLKCPRTEQNRCFEMLNNDYFFYLSYENSLCDDYITEKVANPYRYNTVPIVYSGAKLINYLPPGSYIDAREMSTQELADKIKQLMSNRDEYVKYFWWKDYYRPTMGELYAIPTFCRLCEMLHSGSKLNRTYGDLVKWWQGTDSDPRCLKVR